MGVASRSSNHPPRSKRPRDVAVAKSLEKHDARGQRGGLDSPWEPRAAVIHESRVRTSQLAMFWQQVWEPHGSIDVQDPVCARVDE